MLLRNDCEKATKRFIQFFYPTCDSILYKLFYTIMSISRFYDDRINDSPLWFWKEEWGLILALGWNLELFVSIKTFMWESTSTLLLGYIFILMGLHCFKRNCRKIKFVDCFFWIDVDNFKNFTSSQIEYLVMRMWIL